MDIVTKSREPLFDVVKALMMVWVIWGHLGLYGIVESHPTITMVNAKIGVNMPVFFVISGYFAAFSFAKGTLSRSIVRSICMMWPQVVYALCGATLVLVLTGANFGAVYEQIMGFWFLRCIALIYLGSAIVFKLFKSGRGRWAAFGLAYLALLFWPTRFEVRWMGQLIHMMPYFVFGLMVLPRASLFKSNTVSICCGAFFVGIVLLEGNSDANGMNFWRVTAHWRTVLFHTRDFITFFARTAVGISGSIFLLWAMDRLLKYFPRLESLAVFGTTSLGVYVIHEWIIMMVGPRFSIFPLPEWSRWLVAVVYFLICHFVIQFIKAHSWSKTIFFGNEKWLTIRIERIISFGKTK